MTPTRLAQTYARAFPETRAWGVDEFAALLADPGTFVTGNADAFVLMRVVADEAEVLTLATAPEKRREGRARAVLTEAETEAARRGARVVFLEVAENNDAANALYAACGYHRIGRRPGYYTPKNGAAVAALVLSKRLSRS